MFTLTLPNGQNVTAVSQVALNSNTRFQSNAAGSRVNYFKWAAYPELSEGKILVLESTFLAAIAATASTDIRCILTISDIASSQVFDNVAIVGIEIYNSFFSPDDYISAGNRLLCLTLTLDRRLALTKDGLGFGESYFTDSHDYWAVLVSYLYTNPSLLYAPTYFNKYIGYYNDPIEDVIGYVANSQFLTAYPKARIEPSSSSSSGPITVSTANFKATLTNAVLDPSTINPGAVLFVDSGVTFRNIMFTLKFLNSNYQFGVMEYYDNPGVNYIASPTNSLSNVTTALISPEVVSYAYPFELIDLEYVAPSSGSSSSSESSSSSGGGGTLSPADTIVGYYAAFKQNCVNRLSSRVHLVLQGVSTQSITNDVQRITYSYDQRGATTTLETVPWELPSLNLVSQSTNNLLFIATIKQDMTSSDLVVLGDIYHPLDTLTLIDKDGLVYDPLGLVTLWCKGTSCYVIRTLEGSYIIISGPCNRTSPCPTTSSSSSS